MVCFAFCFFILHGPVRESEESLEIPAARLFALFEQQLDCPIHRNDPLLDLVPIKFIENRKNTEPGLLKLVLQAHGIFLHKTVSSAEGVMFVASRKIKKPLSTEALYCVKVYSPKHLQPEKLVESLKSSKEIKNIIVHLHQHTGRIVLKSTDRDVVQNAMEFLGKLDTNREKAAGYHSFQCVGIKVEKGYEELVRMLSRAIVSRTRFVAYNGSNTLLVACGSDDWKVILGHLKSIDPKGKEK